MRAILRTGRSGAAVLAEGLFLLGILLALPCIAAPASSSSSSPSDTVRVALEDGVVATLAEDRGLLVEAIPKRGEGLALFARRLCGDSRLAPQVAEANGGAKDLLGGIRYTIPFNLLSKDWQLKAVKALFAGDKGVAEGWHHQVRGVGPMQRESLWRVAEWFTGSGENFRAIREYNELHDEEIVKGTDLVIPSELLLPAFRSVLPVPERPFSLDYGVDKDGEYAIYRLRPHEALYSAVVVRFTGRVFAADVNALAQQIARRSGIQDVTSIPVGYRVRIPFDLLQPEFLPEGNPKRKEYEASLRASSQFSNQVRARGLSGITVILDAGHGGLDAGASQGGVWESLYVYDIVMRVKRVLESQTAARVEVTTRDGDGFQVPDVDVLPFSRGHAVLTTPPYPIADAKVGVNLRWYLANSLFRKTVETDKDPQKVVFLSIHADSLHPSLRGAMAYIPAAGMRDESYGKNGPIYALRKEVQESPRVTFPRDQRVRSEGLSRELAKQVVAAFQTGGLPVHPFSPVRDKIIRDNKEWVPAVLRYNSIPAKILLEVCNLNNDQDRTLLQTRAYRQHVAEALVRGLLAYYGQGIGGPSQMAETAK
ncbi:MAG TPA: N-acetylmuramoyl-L-alanine amidase [Thermoanaerobaculia bacterium]|jgi:N-acetylmuramoyl-L-alanine amidase|nr:N-acetylmuramoyl-L-alanine amidase [Thermoanaerobaculia bacterium]